MEIKLNKFYRYLLAGFTLLVVFNEAISSSSSFKEISTYYLIEDVSPVELPKNVIHLRSVNISDEWFKVGPSCPGIKVVDNPVAYPDRQGTFKSYKYGSREFDAVHTFTVVFNTYHFWQNKLLKLSKNAKFSETEELAERCHQNWINLDRSRFLKIYPHIYEIKNNAQYVPSKHALEFGIIDTKYNHDSWVCQSMDVVAHETGHAILHTMKPHFDNSSKAFDEAFGDLTAVFLLLDDEKIQDDIVHQFNKKLHDVPYIGNLAEGFSYKAWKKLALRDMNRKCNTQTCGLEEHNQSQAFSGAVYDALANFLEREEINISQIINQLSMNLLSGILKSQQGNSSEIAQNMINTAMGPWQGYLNNSFQNRLLILAPVPRSLNSNNGSALRFQQFSHETEDSIENLPRRSWFCNFW